MENLQVATILLLHGAWVGPWSLDRYADAARARGHDARALDLVPVARQGGSLAQHVDVVLRALDEAGETVVLGHSLGSLVGLHAALDPRVRALVLVSPISPRGAVELPLGFQLALRHYIAPVLAGRPFELRREDARRLFFEHVARDEADAALDRYTVASGRALREVFLGGARVDPGAVRCPVLAVTGEDDRVATPGAARRLARRLGGDVRIVPGRAHSLAFGPGWEEHAGAILDWIEAATAAGAPAQA